MAKLRVNKYLEKWSVIFISAIAWCMFFGFLSSTSYFVDKENQLQKVLYDFKLTLPGTLKHSASPVYVVNIDDRSLPESACRSPLDRHWLNMVLKAAKRQSFKTIAVNIDLKYSGSPEDKLLLKTIAELDNIVLLNNTNRDYSDLFFKKAKSWGRNKFGADSSRQITSVCNDAVKCVCDNENNCKQKIFHQEILDNYSPDEFYFSGKLNKGWLKINFSAYQNIARRKIYSAAKFLELGPGFLPESSILLVGKKFEETKEHYKNPLASNSSLSSDEQYITSAEAIAAVLNMFLERSFLFSLSQWAVAALLFVVLILLSLTIKPNIGLSPILVSLTLIIFWILASIILFSYYSRELDIICNSAAIFSFGLFSSWYKSILNKINFLELKNQLRKEKIDSLVNKFYSHSVFNFLEHIRYLIHRKNPIVQEYLLSYASFLRQDLEYDSMRQYPLKDQWDYIKNYLNLQNMKHENKIRLLFSADDDLLNNDKYLIPWKLFFPLAENGFKYCEPTLSCSYKETPTIKSVLFMEGNSLVFQISNHFVRDYKVSGSGQGLWNLKKRLQILYPKNDWRLNKEQADNTWIATLIIPVKR